ncbi:cullin-associated NEDD8-dissociated protein 1-like [Daphnia pulex]|uniref:cullin-associated NEDD8-dissociated protein 1-like n=1 Tax=Daphnia pulex TaxID=6669 RepID=UPI001EDD7FE5|nr:cullin-associated NEDD8-dissociated protein 1-like [Daphnia pulex]
MSDVSHHIAYLLEKMASCDKDFRFMATNDLMGELQKDSIKLDDDSEQKVVKMLLHLLEDKNGEIQNLAVRCLGPLVSKVEDVQVETIVEHLCTNMSSDKEQLRDISSTGLKTVISELPLTASGMAASVCKRITGCLNTAIAKQEDVSVQLEALDILADLLTRFGSLLVSFHEAICEALLPQLASPHLAIRKHTIQALGHLVMSCHHTLYVKIMEHLLDGLAKNSTTSTTRTYIQAVGALCRQAGHRFGENVERVVPSLIQFINVDDDELREFCLQAFEALVHKCSKEMTPHIGTLTGVCLELLAYDPNYNYEEENGKDDEGDMETKEEENEEEYSDDDDMSCKIRRCAAKCLEAIISTHPDLLIDFYRTISPVLIGRFKEREENVKADIFHAFIALLKQTKPSGSVRDDVTGFGANQEIYSVLMQQVPLIIQATSKQMKDKSLKTRQGVLALLTELVLVIPGCLSPHFSQLVPGILFCLNERNASSPMKIDTLQFVHTVLIHHPPEVAHEHIAALLPSLLSAVSDPFYKITSEALLVLQQLVRVMRPLDSATTFDFTPYTVSIYDSVLVRLKAADLDQEVKECSISCMGFIVSHLGDHLADKLMVCLPIFLDRLRNEISRLTTVKALTKIASSPLHINISPLLPEALPILAGFLRKNQRALKLTTLALLDPIVNSYSAALTPELLHAVLTEIPPLLSESDLHIAQLTLNLLTSVARNQRSAFQTGGVNGGILSEVFNLLRSPLLQGVALGSLLDFLQALVEFNAPGSGLGYRDLLMCLMNLASKPGLHKTAHHSVAQAVATLVVTQPVSEAFTLVQNFLQEAQRPHSDWQHIFALLCMGEIGKRMDLHQVPGLGQAIIDSFGPPNEEVKSAASLALGSVAVGNLPAFLPFILTQIETQSRSQYLLLNSLKEVITSLSLGTEAIAQLRPFVPQIWDILFRLCECNEEGTRNVVAECLGKLHSRKITDPEGFLPRLPVALSSPSTLMRTTIVTAAKFTISDQVQSIDPLHRLPSRSYWDDALKFPSPLLLGIKAADSMMERQETLEENVMKEEKEESMGQMEEERSQQQLFLEKKMRERKQKKAEKKKRKRIEKRELKRREKDADNRNDFDDDLYDDDEDDDFDDLMTRWPGF